MFFLARRKIEFALTPDLSALGDIWVAVGKSKFGVEVKTSRAGLKWQVKLSQVARVDFYVLVDMDRGQCFVLTAPEMGEVLTNAPVIYGDVRLVNYADIPNKSLNAWTKIDQATPGAQDVDLRTNVRIGKPKVVRKTLANGTVKTYEYVREYTIPGRLDMRRA